MDNGGGFFIFIGILFLAWLMWSSKVQKETFLFYAWAAMIAMSFIPVVIYLFK